MEADKPVTPWLRWVGGKRAVADKLVGEIMATRPVLYIEPFLGGGAVALAMPRHVSKLLVDVNHTLIESWWAVRQFPIALVTQLRNIEQYYGDGKDGYLDARKRFNEMILVERELWLERAAMLMYLNARCFNGLWRTNSQGLFNVPFGSLTNPRRIETDEVVRAGQAIKHCSVRSDHYVRVLGAEATRRVNAIHGNRERMLTVLRGVAVYADPPYDGTFDGYAKHGFTENDQIDLAELLHSYASMGASVWANNSDTPLIRDLYDWAHIEEVSEQHSVGSTGKRRGKRGCLLIRGGRHGA